MPVGSIIKVFPIPAEYRIKIIIESGGKLDQLIFFSIPTSDLVVGLWILLSKSKVPAVRTPGIVVVRVVYHSVNHGLLSACNIDN